METTEGYEQLEMTSAISEPKETVTFEAYLNRNQNRKLPWGHGSGKYPLRAIMTNAV